jgi:hypothetical protein
MNFYVALNSFMIFHNIHKLFPADQGDYDAEVHTPACISEFRFIENQNEQFELDVLEQFQKLK